MTADRWPEVSRVLDELLERPSAEWPALIDELCGTDPVLRQEVEALTAAHDRIDAFMASPPLALAAEALEADPGEARAARWTVGPYRIVRMIARGGMGRVMLGERADGAFTQRVAIKLLRPGRATPDALWRFRTERQILATLDHPNTARLLDGGVTPGGQPWLAMEYVEGVPIDRYADAQGMGVAGRLDLFLTIAAAVQHAHRRLIIHRDLKPGNILVTAAGRPKLLDFGIAKLMAVDEEAPRTSHTRTGQRWMTPAYAAPEQILGRAVTTATDVYQIGAVLYELLAGRRPFEPGERSVRAMEDAVLGEDPVRPSDAVQPASPHARWASSLRGDLDAIVLKALCKEPERRYGSVEAMADDVRRHLAHEPIEARASTRAYRARRFASRHRAGVAAAVAFTLLLAGSAATLALQRAAVVQERDRAAAEAAKSARITDYLMGLFEASDPSRAMGDTITARELLERGVARADALTDQPAVQGTLLAVTGGVYVRLGEYDRGQSLLRRAVATQRAAPARDEEQLTGTLLELAETVHLQESLERAGGLYREVITRVARGHGTRSQWMRAQFGLASVLHAQHRMDEADGAFAIWEAMLDSVPSTADAAQSQVWLGQLLQYRGEYARAEGLLRRGLATHRAVYGDNHVRSGSALNALSSLLLLTDDLEAADSTTRESVALHRRLNPAPNRPLVQSLDYRAQLLQKRGAYAAAESLAREGQAMAYTLFGRDHLVWGRLTARLARILHLQGTHAEAEGLYRGVYAWWVEERGTEYHFTAVSALQLAEVLRARGKFEEAGDLMRASYETFRRDRGVDDVWTTSTAERLRELCEEWTAARSSARRVSGSDATSRISIRSSPGCDLEEVLSDEPELRPSRAGPHERAMPHAGSPPAPGGDRGRSDRPR